jgi:hypothetical protein
MNGTSALTQLYGEQQGSADPLHSVPYGRHGGPESNPPASIGGPPASIGGPPASQHAGEDCPQLSMQLPPHVPLGVQQCCW